MFDVRLIPKEEIATILPLVKMTNPDLSEEVLRDRLEQMLPLGYQCVGVYDGERLIGISGIWTLVKFYVGKHIEPDNVIIHPYYRGQGVGVVMMKWIFDYARSIGCVASELNAYVTNDRGHKFWFNQGYKILGFHFQKKL